MVFFQVMEVHLQGKKHQKKVGFSGMVSRGLGGNSGFGDGVSGRFCCDVCHVETTDENGLVMHKEGKKHRKKMAQLMQDSNRMNY